MSVTFETQSILEDVPEHGQTPPAISPGLTMLLNQRNWMYTLRDNVVYNVARSTYEAQEIKRIEDQIKDAGWPAGVPLPPPQTNEFTTAEVEKYMAETPPSQPPETYEDVIERVDATTTIVSKRPKKAREPDADTTTTTNTETSPGEESTESESEEDAAPDEETTEGTAGEEPVVKRKGHKKLHHRY